MRKRFKVRDTRAGFNDEEAQVYGLELEKIKKKQGKLTPQLVLKEAKKRKSPLHDYFVWDDSEAGQQWRLQQARTMIGNIVEVVLVEGKKTAQRSFFAVKTGKQAEYVTLKEAVTIPSHRQAILKKIITHLENTTVLMKMFQEIK